jgi:hypothetical protein
VPDQPDQPRFRHLAIALGILALLFLVGNWNLPIEKDALAPIASAEGTMQTASVTLGDRVASLTGDLWKLSAEHHGFEFLIAIFTLLLAGFTGTLWWATRKMVKAGPQIERAYISGGGAPEFQVYQKGGGIAEALASVGLPNPPTMVQTGNFQLHINNHGKTPGTLLKFGLGFCDADKVPAEPVYVWKHSLIGLVQVHKVAQ